MSLVREVVVAVLLGVAALSTLIAAVGVLVMRDPLQRLHYIAPPANAAVLILIALVIEGAEPAAWIKATLVAALLALMNGVVTHATARAVFVRSRGGWPPAPGATRAPSGSGEGEAR